MSTIQVFENESRNQVHIVTGKAPKNSFLSSDSTVYVAYYRLTSAFRLHRMGVGDEKKNEYIKITKSI
jgi:hypothetical protein